MFKKAVIGTGLLLAMSAGALAHEDAARVESTQPMVKKTCAMMPMVVAKVPATEMVPSTQSVEKMVSKTVLKQVPAQPMRMEVIPATELSEASTVRKVPMTEGYAAKVRPMQRAMITHPSVVKAELAAMAKQIRYQVETGELAPEEAITRVIELLEQEPARDCLPPAPATN